MATPDMFTQTTGTPVANGQDRPNARLLLADALAGLSFRQIAEAHGLESGDHAETLVTGLLHRWVPATWEEAVRVEQERIEKLIRVADYLAAHRSQSAVASTRAIRHGVRLRRMLGELGAARPQRVWFADPHLSALGVQPEFTPAFRDEFLAALGELGMPEGDLARTAETLEAAASAAPPDRYLTQGDRQRAAAMPRLEQLASLEMPLKRSFQTGAQCEALSGLVDVARARISLLGLVSGWR